MSIFMKAIKKMTAGTADFVLPRLTKGVSCLRDRIYYRNFYLGRGGGTLYLMKFKRHLNLCAALNLTLFLSLN